jgi:hypothetical protein
MRVSKLFKLGRTQATLDFVDVDTRRDTPLFISPRALSLVPSAWGDECVHLVQSFFSTVLERIRDGKNQEAEELLLMLREPNETRLGLSSGASRGRALGDGSAHDVWRALSRSVAAKTGLLKDLEDTVLMVDGISVDIISDMTTNIIRGPLIDYTQEMANQYGIPMSDGVPSGPIWNGARKEWSDGYVKLPVEKKTGKILLVPKAIVRQKIGYDANEYYRHFLLRHMQNAELEANGALVQILKRGKRRVTKSSLIAKHGSNKTAIVTQSLLHPKALAEYKKAQDEKPSTPLSNELIVKLEKAAETNWDALLRTVLDTPVGLAGAPAYEKSIEALLSALLYPQLCHPTFQHEIHDGRKRIDITYTNMGHAGFFQWLSRHYSSSHIFVECKNYGRELANPELDQLSGRFSPSRGQVGFLVARSFQNKALFLSRCRDTSRDGRGFILTLDDGDLTELVRSRKEDPLFEQYSLLKAIFDPLIM